MLARSPRRRDVTPLGSLRAASRRGEGHGGRALLALGVAAFGLGIAAPVDGLGVFLPGPAVTGVARVLGGARRNDGCVGCHADIADEWRGSMHQEAYVDPVFQRALAIEPEPFCRGCHAPDSDPRALPSEASAKMGVGCVSCHWDGAEVVSTRGYQPREEGEREGAHKVRGEEQLAGPDACARCHQFEFPRSPGEVMQDTIEEHRRSAYGFLPCQGCHMPLVGEGDRAHRSHDFSVIGNRSLLSSGLSASAVREGVELVVRLEPTFVGHAFPTGDMFRRLEVRAVLFDAEGRVVSEGPPARLGRAFGDFLEDGHRVRRETTDSRLPPPREGGSPVLVRIPMSRWKDAAALEWSVVYQRMDHAMAVSFGVDQAEDETLIAQGRMLIK